MDYEVDENGRKVCDRDHPYDGSEGRWVHLEAEIAGSCYEGCCDYWCCKVCGAQWKNRQPD